MTSHMVVLICVHLHGGTRNEGVQFCLGDSFEWSNDSLNGGLFLMFKLMLQIRLRGHT